MTSQVEYQNKIFAVYKPKGPSSNQVLEEIRRKTGIKKVGHSGTLDPLAEGVLVVGIGREATKKLSSIIKNEKEYIAKIKLGEESTTDDEEGDKIKINFKSEPSLEKTKRTLLLFKGKILQKPPIFSAIKIKGKEAYKYARRGEKIELSPRRVEIKQIELVDYNWPILTIKAITGPGTYIRTLARDIGDKLSTGGYLTSLKRTRVGDYVAKDATRLEDL